MSILIRGMEMPTNCAECKMYVDDIYCCHLLHRQIENPWADDGVETDCPLVPVPPHGRLIDADAFIKRISELVRKAETDGFDLGAAWYTAFIRHIELAPTIIPASEGKEDE